ncbi:MAG: flagellar hook-associated protein FlgL, partial [Halobacteriovoraceae bacterium]|nr:flagellar hook-associated protein FlgL [Halobacteriovoraceae bacterium]
MTRVSENSATKTLKYNLSKSKERMENLQLKGSSLKQIVRPSDNPISNVEAMGLKSRMKDSDQYIRNSEYAELHLQSTEKAIEQIVDIMNKAKEIAIAQSSDFYDGNIRMNVANEIRQLRNQALAVANKRIGNKYLFGGYKTLSKPFDNQGAYQGDQGKMTVEISKDFFVPINLHGYEVFYADTGTSSKQPDPFERVGPQDGVPERFQDPEKEEMREADRGLASKEEAAKEYDYQKRSNVFSLLEGLTSSLENNDPTYTQSLLEEFDDAINRLVTMRTKVGSIMNSVSSSQV